MEKIIKKAIDGGWKEEELFIGSYAYFPNGMGNIEVRYDRIYMTRLKKNGKSGRVIQYWKFQDLVIDTTFWKALSVACKWKGNRQIEWDERLIQKNIPDWHFYALRFHELNLTSGFNEAVKWLEGLVNDTK